jgi:hypothetical protein
MSGRKAESVRIQLKKEHFKPCTFEWYIDYLPYFSIPDNSLSLMELKIKYICLQIYYFYQTQSNENCLWLEGCMELEDYYELSERDKNIWKHERLQIAANSLEKQVNAPILQL